MSVEDYRRPPCRRKQRDVVRTKTQLREGIPIRMERHGKGKVNCPGFISKNRGGMEGPFVGGFG